MKPDPDRTRAIDEAARGVYRAAERLLEEAARVVPAHLAGGETSAMDRIGDAICAVGAAYGRLALEMREDEPMEDR